MSLQTYFPFQNQTNQKQHLSQAPHALCWPSGEVGLLQYQDWGPKNCKPASWGHHSCLEIDRVQAIANQRGWPLCRPLPHSSDERNSLRNRKPSVWCPKLWVLTPALSLTRCRIGGKLPKHATPQFPIKWGIWDIPERAVTTVRKGFVNTVPYTGRWSPVREEEVRPTQTEMYNWEILKKSQVTPKSVWLSG